MWQGQDASFDLLNYHYYNGWAFVHGRLDRDILPAGLQTFHAPLADALHYLGLAHLPPRIFGFLLGVLQGLAIPVLYRLARLLLPGGDGTGRATALVLAVLGGCGHSAVSLLGTAFGENLAAIPLLAALALVVREVSDASTPPLRTALAGALAGAAVGLKLTLAPGLLGLSAALLLAPGPGEKRVRRVAALAIGGLLGFAAAGGWWSLGLWQRFGNPVFPYANAVFRSPFAAPRNWRDERWMAHDVYDLLLRPAIDLASGRLQRLQEAQGRDLRFLLVLAALLACTLAIALRLSRRRTMPRAGGGEPVTPAALSVLAFWGVSYLAWAAILYYYRYAVALEQTAPLVAFVLLRSALPRRSRQPVLLACALLLLLTTVPGSWGRRAWAQAGLDFDLPGIGRQRGAMVLLVGQPTSVVAPSFGDDAVFVNLTGFGELGAPDAWKPRIGDAIRGHRGPLLLVQNFIHYSRAHAEQLVGEHGLRTRDCTPLVRPGMRFRLCSLEPTPRVDVRSRRCGSGP